MEASLNNFHIHHIDAKDTDFYKPVLSNLTNPEFAKDLLNTEGVSALGKTITQQSRFDAEYRSRLVEVLKLQYQKSLIDLTSDSEVFKNIEKLRDTNTLTVTTGQQIHIFLGPFFVVNKILSCCAEANKIAEELPDNDVVPVFWMASEDHDFDEIKSTRLYNETYDWEMDSQGPVGRLNPKSLVALVEKAQQRIDQTEDNLQFLDDCKYAYANCNTFADATRYIVHKHFEDTGIVVIDPDDPFLKSKSIDLFQSDIFDHKPSAAIDKGIETMKRFGIKAPINTRPINTFYITDNQRNRIEKKNESLFSLVGTETTFSADQLRQKIKDNPECFSPNALLRPLYQQTILPNIQYVCGASEIIYWLELKNAMEGSELVYPILSIRKSMFFVSEKNVQKLDKNQIPLAYLFLSEANVTEIIVSKDSDVLADLESGIASVAFQLNQINNTFKRFDFIQSKKSEKINNQAINELKQQHAKVVDHASKENPVLHLVSKIKSNVYDESYNQERSKFILGMIPQMKMAQSIFNSNTNIFVNHRIITAVSH